MLQILDSKKKKIAYFDNYKDLCIESVLNTGDSTLSFLYPLNGKWINYLIEENYIITKTNEYVIKAKRNSSDDIEITCKLNLEDLEGTPFDRYISEIQNITNALNLALVGTGWTVANNNISKKRTVIKTNCSSYDIIQEIKKIYRVDLVFDTLNKKIYVYENLGEDKGAYAIEKLNLVSLDIESDSYNYYTRIIPVGKDGLTIESINSGKKYVENFQYTSKIKTLYWTDERYTIPESLKEDAIAKLEDLSKPYRSYLGEIKNLAKLNKKYSSLEFNLGDTITLISKRNKIKDKQRIVKIIEYPQDHSKDSFEIANLILRFEDQQDRFEEAAEIINNVTTDDGTINGESIDEIRTDKIKNFTTEIGKVVNLEAVNAKINKLEVNKADIQSLNAVEAKIGTLEVTKASITELNATNANISNLQATKADITELNSAVGKIEILESESAKIGVLEGNLANIQDIIGGNISSENIQTGGITGDRLNMSTIFVSDANIVNINASKINSGEIDTSKIKIKSSDGAIEIAGATQQFKDKNNKVRIQMGKDTQGNFNFILRGEDGTTTLIDHKGIKEKAIADNLIKENMVAENAVGEKAINYNSFSTGFNKETNTNTLKATKIRLDNQNQSLEIAFNSLKSQSDDTKKKTESNTTQIQVEQGKINSLIQDTTIIKDGQNLKLKDEYNKTVQTVNTIKNTISEHTTKINEQTGKITGVESKTNILERDLNSMSSKIIATETTANNAITKIDTMELNTRNLLSINNILNRSSKDFIKNNFKISFTHSDLWSGFYIKNLKDIMKLNEIYTFQYKIRKINGSLKGISQHLDNQFEILNYTIDGISYPWGNTVTDMNIDDYNWHHCILRFKRKTDIEGDGTGDTNRLIPQPNRGLALEVRVEAEDFSITNSKKIPDWIPSPEDINQNIQANKDSITNISMEVTSTKNKVSGIEQNINSITQRVGSVESVTKSHTTTISSHTNSLNAVDGKINTAKSEALTASKNYTNLEVNKVVTSTNSKFAEIKTTTDSITQRVSATESTTTTLTGKVNNMTSPSAMPYQVDLIINGDSNKYYPVYIRGGNQDLLRTIKIWRTYSEQAPSDWNTATHKGSLMLTWQGNFGGWGGASYKEYILEHSSQYTPLLADCKISVHSMGYTFFLRGGGSTGAKYHFGSDQSISPKVYYNGASDKVYDHENPSYVVYAFEPLTKVNTARLNDLKLARESSVSVVKNQVSEIKTTTDSISSRVSKVESTTTTINNKVTTHESRLTSAEQKITATAITSTVTSSTTYKNDLNGKVSTSKVISSINQTAETIKINAKKIQLEGCTTVGTGGRRVQINNADYAALLNNQERMFWGFRDFENAYLVPKFYMGAYGFDTTQHNYFGITPYKGNGDNPQGSSSAYVDLSYRCINSNFKDWSNIKMSSDGRIRIAPIENLEITTNFLNGAYAGTGERRLALFATSTSSYFNSNLQIGCLRNMDNGNGLILADDQRSGYETRVRVNTDSSNNKFFRPLTNSGDIACGSASFPWKSIHTKSTYTIEALRCNRNISIRDVKINEIVDNIDFIQPRNVNESVIMDVSKISGTAFAPIQENVQTINTSELLKLALMEIKNLKQEIENIKTRE